MPLRAIRRRSERGAALLEFVLVIPIFLFVLYGLIAYGMAISLEQSVTHAASQGARAAIGAQAPTSGRCLTSPYTDDYGQTYSTSQYCFWGNAAHAQVESALSWLGSTKESYVTVTPTVATCAGDSSNTCITVALSYDYADHPIVPAAPGLGLVTPNTIASTAVVQVQ